MRLYHGSNVKIDTIEPLRGKKGKDFGRGFYLSAIFEQAQRSKDVLFYISGRSESDTFAPAIVGIEQIKYQIQTRRYGTEILPELRNAAR